MRSEFITRLIHAAVSQSLPLAAEVRRRGNFHFLHRELGSINKLRIDPDSVGTPFCYPFRTNLAELRGVSGDEAMHGGF
ncbi:MAG: hypothetical protein LIO63_03800 [Akkermansia sp.]|nr:hypothetical protein [Akkermansia sp.]